jgi:hypothetical protein
MEQLARGQKLKRNQSSESSIHIKGNVNIDEDGIIGNNANMIKTTDGKHSLFEVLVWTVTLIAGLIAIYSFIKGK